MSVIWHDVECGGYAADLPLWRDLAEAAGGPVLDVGAGTGRVTADLASHGFDVHALDVDAELLAELRRRAPGVPVHVADARDFAIGIRFPLVIVPMQTLQLLATPRDREAFLRCAHRHLLPGGLLAAALANALDEFVEGEVDVRPDMRDIDGIVYASRPTAVRADGDGFIIERLRETVSDRGEHTAEPNSIRLVRITAERLATEGAAVGFHPQESLFIEPTEDYVGSEVAMLRA